jgi:predicted transcriptional regulator
MIQKQRHRSSCEIEIALLRNVLPNGEKKTSLMYKSNLSSKEINYYISLLLRHRLLEYDSVLRIYQITNIGERILYMCERLVSEIRD